jgi:hypothetical protein
MRLSGAVSSNFPHRSAAACFGPTRHSSGIHFPRHVSSSFTLLYICHLARPPSSSVYPELPHVYYASAGGAYTDVGLCMAILGIYVEVRPVKRLNDDASTLLRLCRGVPRTVCLCYHQFRLSGSPQWSRCWTNHQNIHIDEFTQTTLCLVLVL